MTCISRINSHTNTGAQRTAFHSLILSFQQFEIWNLFSIRSIHFLLFQLSVSLVWLPMMYNNYSWWSIDRWFVRSLYYTAYSEPANSQIQTIRLILIDLLLVAKCTKRNEKKSVFGCAQKQYENKERKKKTLHFWPNSFHFNFIFNFINAVCCLQGLLFSMLSNIRPKTWPTMAEWSNGWEWLCRILWPKSKNCVLKNMSTIFCFLYVKRWSMFCTYRFTIPIIHRKTERTKLSFQLWKIQARPCTTTTIIW